MKFDKDVFELIKLVLESELPKSTKDEVTRFYTLPRITGAIPAIEQVRDSGVGTVARPDAQELEDLNDKVLQDTLREQDKAFKKAGL